MNGKLSDERGTTLVELMVGLAAGMVVLAALSMVMIVAIRTTSRVGARVDATQRARVVMTQMVEQLHSACIQPQMAPVLAESTQTKLVFIHAKTGTASAVAPTPVKSTISLEGSTLTQKDTAWVSGVNPNWVWSTATPSMRTLLTKVGPLTTSGPIFTYWVYSNGVLKSVPLSGTSKLEGEAAKTVEVQITLNALPTSQPVKDAGSDSSVQDMAVLRLTPPTYAESAPALPCQ